MAKLLLVEDDNNLREIYEARLQAEGYQIVSAKDGEEALVVAKTEKPDLVISDVMMPKISGFEMLDIMRNTDELKGVKVIMLTALGQSDDQKRADKLGADRYLVKSQVTLEDIVRTAHELLGDQEGGDAAPGAAPEAASEAAGSPATPETAAPAPAQAPAPAPAPAPEPKPEPAATAASETPAEASKEAAEPAAQEEADVEAKIENFVAGATSEPTAPPQPEAAAAAAPETPAPSPAPAATAATSDDKASDDKLMADAVEQLVASTGQQDAAQGGSQAQAPAAPAKTSIPVSVAPSDDNAQPATDPKPADAGSDDSAGGRKKVIEPLDSAPKKDINELLAEEEAKENQSIPGATVTAPGSTSSEDRPSGAPMPPPSEAAQGNVSGPGPSDPNSIAL
jgi:CheY-like chemotaxis protein